MNSLSFAIRRAGIYALAGSVLLVMYALAISAPASAFPL